MTNGITFTKAYATSDGRTFTLLREAQKHELEQLCQEHGGESADTLDVILAHAATVINILSTTASSRPKARKANGATRKRPTRVDPMAATQATFKQTAE